MLLSKNVNFIEYLPRLQKVYDTVGRPPLVDAGYLADAGMIINIGMGVSIDLEVERPIPFPYQLFLACFANHTRISYNGNVGLAIDMLRKYNRDMIHPSALGFLCSKLDISLYRGEICDTPIDQQKQICFGVIVDGPRFEDIVCVAHAGVDKSVTFEGVRYCYDTLRNRNNVVVLEIPIQVKKLIYLDLTHELRKRDFFDVEFYKSNYAYALWAYEEHVLALKSISRMCPGVCAIAPGDGLGLVASVFENSISGDLVYSTSKVREETLRDTLRRGSVHEGPKVVILSYVATFMDESDWMFVRMMGCPVFILDSRGKNLDRNIGTTVSEIFKDSGDMVEVLPGCLGIGVVGSTILPKLVKYATWSEGGTKLSVPYSENLLKVEDPEIVEICPSILYLIAMRPHLKPFCRSHAVQAMLRILGIPYRDGVGMPLVNTLPKVRVFGKCYFIPSGKMIDGIVDINISKTTSYIYVPVQAVVSMPSHLPAPHGPNFLRDGTLFCCTAPHHNDCVVQADTHDNLRTYNFLFIPHEASINKIIRRGDALFITYKKGEDKITVIVRDLPTLFKALVNMDIMVMPPYMWDAVYTFLVYYERMAFIRYIRLCYQARRWIPPGDFYAKVGNKINWGAFYIEETYHGDPFLSKGKFHMTKTKDADSIVEFQGHPMDVVSTAYPSAIKESQTAFTMAQLSDE